MTKKTIPQLAAEITALQHEEIALSKVFNAEKITIVHNGKKLHVDTVLQLKSHLNDTIADISAKRILLEHELTTRTA